MRDQRKGDVKAGAKPFLRGNLKGATHERGQLATYRKAKARAAKIAGGCVVDLFKGSEHFLYLVFGDADASVEHRDHDPALVRRGDAQGDMAIKCEFQGISGNIHQDLTQTPGIAQDHIRQLWRNVREKFKPFARGQRCQKLGDILDNLAQPVGFLREGELARLDLGKIKDVVDDRQQGITGAHDRAHIAFLFAVQRGLAEHVGHADDAVHRGPDFVAHLGKEGRFRLVGGNGRFARILKPADQRMQGAPDDDAKGYPVRQRGNKDTTGQQKQKEITLIAFEGGDFAFVKAGHQFGDRPGIDLIGQGQRRIGPLTAKPLRHNRQHLVVLGIGQFDTANGRIAQHRLHKVGDEGARPVHRAVTLVAKAFQCSADASGGIADAHGHRLFAAQQVFLAHPQQSTCREQKEGGHHHCGESQVKPERWCVQPGAVGSDHATIPAGLPCLP